MMNDTNERRTISREGSGRRPLLHQSGTGTGGQGNLLAAAAMTRQPIAPDSCPKPGPSPRKQNGAPSADSPATKTETKESPHREKRAMKLLPYATLLAKDGGGEGSILGRTEGSNERLQNKPSTSSHKNMHMPIVQAEGEKNDDGSDRCPDFHHSTRLSISEAETDELMANLTKQIVTRRKRAAPGALSTVTPHTPTSPMVLGRVTSFRRTSLLGGNASPIVPERKKKTRGFEEEGQSSGGGGGGQRNKFPALVPPSKPAKKKKKKVQSSSAKRSTGSSSDNDEEENLDELERERKAAAKKAALQTALDNFSLPDLEKNERPSEFVRHRIRHLKTNPKDMKLFDIRCTELEKTRNMKKADAQSARSVALHKKVDAMRQTLMEMQQQHRTRGGTAPALTSQKVPSTARPRTDGVAVPPLELHPAAQPKQPTRTSKPMHNNKGFSEEESISRSTSTLAPLAASTSSSRTAKDSHRSATAAKEGEGMTGTPPSGAFFFSTAPLIEQIPLTPESPTISISVTACPSTTSVAVVEKDGTMSLPAPDESKGKGPEAVTVTTPKVPITQEETFSSPYLPQIISSSCFTSLSIPKKLPLPPPLGTTAYQRMLAGHKRRVSHAHHHLSGHETKFEKTRLSKKAAAFQLRSQKMWLKAIALAESILIVRHISDPVLRAMKAKRALCLAACCAGRWWQLMHQTRKKKERLTVNCVFRKYLPALLERFRAKKYGHAVDSVQRFLVDLKTVFHFPTYISRFARGVRSAQRLVRRHFLARRLWRAAMILSWERQAEDDLLDYVLLTADVVEAAAIKDHRHKRRLKQLRGQLRQDGRIRTDELTGGVSASIVDRDLIVVPLAMFIPLEYRIELVRQFTTRWTHAMIAASIERERREANGEVFAMPAFGGGNTENDFPLIPTATTSTGEKSGFSMTGESDGPLTRGAMSASAIIPTQGPASTQKQHHQQHHRLTAPRNTDGGRRGLDSSVSGGGLSPFNSSLGLAPTPSPSGGKRNKSGQDVARELSQRQKGSTLLSPFNDSLSSGASHPSPLGIGTPSPSSTTAAGRRKAGTRTGSATGARPTILSEKVGVRSNKDLNASHTSMPTPGGSGEDILCGEDSFKYSRSGSNLKGSSSNLKGSKSVKQKQRKLTDLFALKNSLFVKREDMRRLIRLTQKEIVKYQHLRAELRERAELKDSSSRLMQMTVGGSTSTQANLSRKLALPPLQELLEGTKENTNNPLVKHLSAKFPATGPAADGVGVGMGGGGESPTPTLLSPMTVLGRQHDFQMSAGNTLTSEGSLDDLLLLQGRDSPGRDSSEYVTPLAELKSPESQMVHTALSRGIFAHNFSNAVELIGESSFSTTGAAPSAAPIAARRMSQGRRRRSSAFSSATGQALERKRRLSQMADEAPALSAGEKMFLMKSCDLVFFDEFQTTTQRPLVCPLSI